MTPSQSALRVALLGNPNCGKTALFNLLTGSRQKVANYAGVTVERKEGQFETPNGQRIRVLDLPGAYSLNAISLDETITRDVVLGTKQNEERPDLLVCVTDATNLRLNLRLVVEAKRLGLPTVLALNMADVAKHRGVEMMSLRSSGTACPWCRPLPGGADELISAIQSHIPDRPWLFPWKAPDNADGDDPVKSVAFLPCRARTAERIARGRRSIAWCCILCGVTCSVSRCSDVPGCLQRAQLPMDAIRRESRATGSLIRDTTARGHPAKPARRWRIAGAEACWYSCPRSSSFSCSSWRWKIRAICHAPHSCSTG
jgi:ferrous iron transport protein B